MGNKIEWTDRTWNVITGCKKLSPACVNCYAESMTKRLQGMAIKEVEKNIRICGYCARELLKKIDKSQKRIARAITQVENIRRELRKLL